MSTDFEPSLWYEKQIAWHISLNLAFYLKNIRLQLRHLLTPVGVVG